MAATANQSANPKRGSEVIQRVLDRPIKAATHCYAGTIAVIDAGFAAPGRAATGLIAAGWFEKEYDNSGSTGLRGEIHPGARFAANSTGADAIADANVGSDCYIVDDITVALTDGGETRSRAGKIVAVDAVYGVCVEIVNTGREAGGPKIQSGTATFVAGVATVNTVIELTAASRIVATHKVPAGTFAPGGIKAVVTTPGAPGTAVATFTALNVGGTTETAFTGTFDYHIAG